MHISIDTAEIAGKDKKLSGFLTAVKFRTGAGLSKRCYIQLLFWSGQTFEDNLKPVGKYKAAEARYTEVKHINTADLTRWLDKSKAIQWDYKNLVKRQGILERLK